MLKLTQGHCLINLLSLEVFFMNNLLKQRTDLFLQNRDLIKNNFRWDNSMLFPLCACLYTEQDLQVDIHKIKVAKNILKNNTGLFSNFRGTVSLVYETMLSLEEDPNKTMKNALKAHASLKREFWSSQYLPLSAFLMAKVAETFDYDKISRKAKLIYQMMKNKHPFLTSAEDSGFAVVYAISAGNIIPKNIFSYASSLREQPTQTEEDMTEEAVIIESEEDILDF